jgi:chromosomal replication initiator protein
MSDVWKQVKSVLQQRIPPHSFRMWIEPMASEQDGRDTLVLSCPNGFSRRRVLEQYGALIEKTIQALAGKGCQIVLRNGVGATPEAEPPAADEGQRKLPDVQVQPHGGRLLRKDFTFDQFVVGGSNDFAYSASLAVASRKNTQQSCLYLLSKTGMGKSHLSQAIGHHVLTAFPTERVYYMTAEDFSHEMVSAYRHDCMEAFKGKYRSGCDVLLLEDVHCLSGKDRTQQELAMTLDFLFESGKKVIFSSSCLPTEIPKLDDKLCSRLTYGLVSSIEAPDFNTRVRILKKKAQGNHCEVPDEVLRYLASELTEDIRQLESGLIGVSAKSSLLGGPIDLELAASVVKNIARRRKEITIDVIKKQVCKFYGVALPDLMSRSRKQSIVRPRQMAIYLSRKYTDAPLQLIGKSFNRYHATALHSINAIESGLKKSSDIQEQVAFFTRKLESGKF